MMKEISKIEIRSVFAQNTTIFFHVAVKWHHITQSIDEEEKKKIIARKKKTTYFYNMTILRRGCGDAYEHIISQSKYSYPLLFAQTHSVENHCTILHSSVRNTFFFSSADKSVYCLCI